METREQRLCAGCPSGCGCCGGCPVPGQWPWASCCDWPRRPPGSQPLTGPSPVHAGPGSAQNSLKFLPCRKELGTLLEDTRGGMLALGSPWLKAVCPHQQHTGTCCRTPNTRSLLHHALQTFPTTISHPGKVEERGGRSWTRRNPNRSPGRKGETRGKMFSKQSTGSLRA